MTKDFIRKTMKRAMCLFIVLNFVCLIGRNQGQNEKSFIMTTAKAATIRKCYTINTGNTRVYSNTALTRGYGWIYPTDIVTVYTVTDRYSYVGYPAGNRVKKDILQQVLYCFQQVEIHIRIM